jgi:hypothetical protein
VDGVTDLEQPATEMTDEKLYERDFPAWCERQGERLRRAAAEATGRVQPDWARVIEEIEDMGASQRRQVESLLVQAMMHLMKIKMAPNGPDVPHWTEEIRTFLGDGVETFAPSMRQAINVDRLYRMAAFRVTGRRIGGSSPFRLNDLLEPYPDIVALIAKLP